MAAPDRFELLLDGHRHVVEAGPKGLGCEAVWWVDGVETARRRSSESRFSLRPAGSPSDGEQTAAAAGTAYGVLGIRATALGHARRVTLFQQTERLDAAAAAQLGQGGIDLTPAAGSRAARHEAWVRDHPRQYAAVAVAGGVAKVVVPLLLAALAVRLVIDLPWPDWDLPSIPWPSIPWPDLPSIPWPSIPWPDWRLPDWLRWLLDKVKYVWPILLAVVLARAEIRRRRHQDRRRAELDAPSSPDPDPRHDAD